MRAYGSYETRKKLDLDAFPQYSSPSLTRTRGSNDEDDFTLEGFGNISLSNENFLPPLSPAPAPLKKVGKPVGKDIDMKTKKTLTRVLDGLVETPTKGRFVMDRQVQRKLPSLMQNLMPPSPSKPRTTTEPTFDDLVEALKLGDRRSAERIMGKETFSRVVGRPSHLRKNSADPKALKVDSTEDSDSEDSDATTIRPSSLSSLLKDKEKSKIPTIDWKKPCPPAKAKASRPLRGNAPLPKRLPLPRWDLPANNADDMGGSCRGTSMTHNVRRT